MRCGLCLPGWNRLNDSGDEERTFLNVYNIMKERTGRQWCYVTMSLMFGAVVIASIVFYSSSSPAQKYLRDGLYDTDPLVKTLSGKVKGQIVETPALDKVQEYLGIPFAKPPVGRLRFANPEPAKKWSGTLDARQYGPSCYQPLDLTFGNFQGSAMWNAPGEMSEDCLSINVWVPHPRPQNAAVMVWIYGGGFFSGSSALWVYDGKTLAGRTGVVVVSMNYRVGSLGYLATGDGRIKGNFGMMDQVLALKWVKKNIVAFGGDPNMVTIFGESAGGSSVGMHLMSPLSKNLFKRAIIQSSSPEAHWSFMDQKTARSRSQLLLSALDCPDDEQALECLRQIQPEEIVANEWVDGSFLVFPWAPTIDGLFLSSEPHKYIESHRMKKTELLIGANKDEGTFWILYGVPTYHWNTSSPQTRQDLKRAVDIADYDLSSAVRREVLDLYTEEIRPNDLYGNRDALDDIVGDRSFLCPSVDFASAYVRSRQSVYMYYLTHRASNEVWPDWMGVIHGADIQYVFGMPFNHSRGYSADEVVLSDRMMTYWSNFAKSGHPNGNQVSGLATWPKHNWGEYLEFVSGTTFNRKMGLRTKYCDFWRMMGHKRTASEILKRKLSFLNRQW